MAISHPRPLEPGSLRTPPQDPILSWARLSSPRALRQKLKHKSKIGDPHPQLTWAQGRQGKHLPRCSGGKTSPGLPCTGPGGGAPGSRAPPGQQRVLPAAKVLTGMLSHRPDPSGSCRSQSGPNSPQRSRVLPSPSQPCLPAEILRPWCLPAWAHPAYSRPVYS